MARSNPEVERLTRHVDVLKRALDRIHENPPDLPFLACGHSCICAKATGMATNGPCNCNEKKLRVAVQYWKMVAQHRAAIMKLHRESGCPDLYPEDDVAEPNKSPDKRDQ